MKVRFLGVRGSIPTPGPETARYGGNTSCLTVEHDDALLILDAGTGIRKLGLELAQRGGGQTYHLLLTHTHWDHIQGFPFFVPSFIPGNTIHIYGLPPLDKPLDVVLKGQMDPEYFPVALGEIAAKFVVHDLREANFSLGPYKIRRSYMNHPGVTLGYRIEAGGRTFVFATDNEPFRHLYEDVPAPAQPDKTYGRTRDNDLIPFISDADLLVADAQYTVEEYKTRMGWGHSSYAAAVGIAIQGRAKRLALFHLDPMHADEEIDRHVFDAQSRARARGSALEIFAAREGETVEV